MASFGPPTQPTDEPRGEHLAVCSQAQAEAVLAQIQGVLPVVNVFFELGRQGAIFGQPNIEAFRLLDIAHHTRLPDVTQVIACLDIINQTFSNVCGDATAKFCGFDREGHCFIALETQQNILRLWHKVIASQQLARDGQLMAYQHDGFWFCMDTPRDYQQLSEMWATGHAPWAMWEGQP